LAAEIGLSGANDFLRFLKQKVHGQATEDVGENDVYPEIGVIRLVLVFVLEKLSYPACRIIARWVVFVPTGNSVLSDVCVMYGKNNGYREGKYGEEESNSKFEKGKELGIL
jgi:hypothetical protein